MLHNLWHFYEETPIGEDAPNYYNWDVRKCNITPVAGNINADLLKWENQGHHGSLGNSTYAYREIKTTYFEDNGKSYLFVYIGDSSGVYMDSLSTLCPNFYVFRITNHATSIKEDIHETDSIELELIQTETETYGALGVFYPVIPVDLKSLYGYNLQDKKSNLRMGYCIRNF